MKLNLSGRIAKFFLYNRPLTILVLTATIAVGIGAYLSTPKQYNPTIILPAFQVEVGYPGATANEVEHFITQELEETISDIDGVDEIYSRSIDGGASIVTVMFDVGEDLEESKIKLSQKIQENIEQKTFAMQTPIIKSIDPESVPIITFGFFSSQHSQNELRSLVFEIMDQLRKVPNVANLEVHGGEGQSLQILLDPGKMKLHHVSISQIKQSIQASNFNRQLGTLRDSTYRNLIEISGTFQSAEEASKIIVAPGIQLQDVASLRDGSQEKTSFVTVSSRNIKDDIATKDAVFISVAKRKGTNAIDVSTQTKEALQKILQQQPFSNITIHTFRDDGIVAQKAINGLSQNLLASILIVSLVLLLFLGWRSAMVVAIAIPLTIALVFVAGKLFGGTINRITLFALILSLGLLVDNATVIIENIHRHCSLGKDKKKAIIEAVNEVGMGLFISTLTSVIVFLPTSQITGMMGEYMGPLSFFVPMALIMSLLVAYVLTPFLADILLKAPELCALEIHEEAIAAHKKKIHWSLFDSLTDWYGKWLGKHLGEKNTARKKRFLRTVFLAFFIVLLFPVLNLVHFKMLPSADKEQFFVSVDLPEGTDTPQTEIIAHWITQQFLTHPEVISIQSFTGSPSVTDFNGLLKGSNLRKASHLANIRVNLTQPEQRSVTSSEIVTDLRETIRTKKLTAPQSILPWLTQTNVKFVEDPPGPPVRSTLEIKIKGPDRAVLEQVAKDVEQLLPNIKGIVDTDTSIEYAAQKTVLLVDHEKALQAGISTAQVSETINALLNPWIIGQYHLSDQREIATIELLVEKSQQDQIQDISHIFIPNQRQEMVPLLSIVTIKRQRTVPTLYTDEREATIYVTGETENRSIVYAVIDLIKPIKNLQFPNDAKLTSWNLFGFTFETNDAQEYHIEWGGEWQMTIENFRDLGKAMLIAFFLIYIVLVAQFSSFKKSLLIMTTMPLGFIGILPGFAILDAGWGIFLTATSLIGFIALMGIVVNNAIMYVEYLEILRDKGMELHEALVLAGKTRLRPILLTSATTILGNLTIVTDPVWSGLAWSIVFGLSLSAVLTLGVFPLLYENNAKSFPLPS
jgi:multidrug efflux pump subunit AcrB